MICAMSYNYCRIVWTELTRWAPNIREKIEKLIIGIRDLIVF